MLPLFISLSFLCTFLQVQFFTGFVKFVKAMTHFQSRYVCTFNCISIFLIHWEHVSLKFDKLRWVLYYQSMLADAWEFLQITDMLQHWVYDLVEFRHKKHWLDLGKDSVLASNTHCLGLPELERLEYVPTSQNKQPVLSPQSQLNSSRLLIKMIYLF